VQFSDWISFLFFGWGLPFSLYVLFQVVAPLLAEGKYRALAMVPVPIMCIVVVVTFFSYQANSNLWPIWLILVSPFMLLYLMLVLGFGLRNSKRP